MWATLCRVVFRTPGIWPQSVMLVVVLLEGAGSPDFGRYKQHCSWVRRLPGFLNRRLGFGGWVSGGIPPSVVKAVTYAWQERQTKATLAKASISTNTPRTISNFTILCTAVLAHFPEAKLTTQSAELGILWPEFAWQISAQTNQWRVGIMPLV
jgi:hypothetical protein